MIMNDDTWYVVRNTRGVTGFVGPGSKPVPLTDAEMAPLGIQQDNIVVDFAESVTPLQVDCRCVGRYSRSNPGYERAEAECYNQC